MQKKDLDVESLISEIRTEDHDYFKSSVPRYKRLKNFFQEKPAGKVLDLGCSPGHNAIILSRIGFEVLGIDLNDFYLPKYNPNWFNEFNRLTWNIEDKNLPFESNSFDYVIFTEVLEHIAIKHPKEIFQEIRRVLKPNGFLYITTPNVACFSNMLTLLLGDNIFWKPIMFYGSTDRHNREYTWKEVRDILLEAGFKTMIFKFFTTWSNNKKYPLNIISFLIKTNLNSRLIDNTIEVIIIK